MFGKLKALYNLVKMGEEVANPVFWKKMQRDAQPVLAALLIAIVGLLKGTKYEIPMDDTTALLISGGIFAAVNWVLTTITSKKMGVGSNELSAKPLQEVLPTIQLPQGQPPVEDHSYGKEMFPLTPALIAEAREALDADRGRN